MHIVQIKSPSTHNPDLLDALAVQQILNVDRSTVYRMAEDGRLPAIRVGRLWRFPAQRIYELADSDDAPLDRRIAQILISLAAELLGVMIVVTDMDGRPITPIANPCPWMSRHAEEPEVVTACLNEWRGRADDPDFESRFVPGRFGFECAHAFIRSGRELVAMVVAGGVSPAGGTDPDFHHLDPAARERVLNALPRVAAALTHTASAAGAKQKE